MDLRLGRRGRRWRRRGAEGEGVRVRVRVWVVGLWLGEGVRAAVGSRSIRRWLMHDPRDMPMDQSERTKQFEDFLTI